MSLRTVIWLVLIGSSILILIEYLYRKNKAGKMQKEAIRARWGKPPKVTDYDKEESLKKAYHLGKSTHNFDSQIDDITWHDLDMSTVFSSINTTYSSLGAEALYRRFRCYSFEQDKDLSDLIEFFDCNPEVRERTIDAFAKLGKQNDNGTQAYLAGEYTPVMKSLSFYLVFATIPLVGFFLSFIFATMGNIILITGMAINALYYYLNEQKYYSELEKVRYLIQIVLCAKKLTQEPLPMQKKIKNLVLPFESILSTGIAFGNNWHDEISRGSVKFAMLFMMPFISAHVVYNKMGHQRGDLLTLWELLGNLEIACCILNLRTFQSKTAIPTFDTVEVHGNKMYHPLLKQPVENDVNWEQITLVTGSNASGKSTYVKSVAINCILAQTIQTVFAESFSMRPGHVLTSMAVSDNLFEGNSYFVAEIKSIKRLLNRVATGERCYCFVDEILKGTNTVERISASSSLIEWLDGYSSLAFIATHDIELPIILEGICHNIHFSEKILDEGITFDYKLQHGPATSRNAIALLEVMNYPEEIIVSAQKKAHHFDSNQHW